MRLKFVLRRFATRFPTVTFLYCVIVLRFLFLRS